MIGYRAIAPIVRCNQLYSRSMSSFITSSYHINGKWEKASKDFKVLNPSDSKLIGTAADCTAVEAQNAVEIAYAKFNDKTWKSWTCKQRADLLANARKIMLENADELANLIVIENGKPLAEAHGEVIYSANYFNWFSAECQRTYGDIIPPSLPNRRMLVTKHPIGVVSVITPWNFPLAMLARKLAALVGAGCTAVCKPSEETPYSALALANIMAKAGLPDGVFNVIPCSRENLPSVSDVLCTDPRISKISFTGSTAVAKILMKKGSDTLKRLSLEAGGNAPVVVFPSARIDIAVKGIMNSKFRGSGQTCVCANRIFVHENVYDEVAEKLVNEISKLKLGCGLDAGVTQGPLINEAAVAKVTRLVDDAVKKGADVAAGGKRTLLESGGTFFQPTLLLNVSADMAVFREEIFGPVAALVKFQTEEEVLELANDCRAGLAAYVFSEDYSQIWRVSDALNAGIVGVNEGLVSAVEAPFGGVKESGIGKEGSKYGMDEYLEKKYVCMGGIQE